MCMHACVCVYVRVWLPLRSCCPEEKGARLPPPLLDRSCETCLDSSPALPRAGDISQPWVQVCACSSHVPQRQLASVSPTRKRGS